MVILAAIIGYVLGSIPFGLVITRMAGTEDLRSIGSGNIGATNVLRTGRKGLAAATLFLDGVKGTLAVLIAGRLGGHDAELAAGLFAFLGHLYPVWLNYKGGKGVATFFGVMLGLIWPVFLIGVMIWLGIAYFYRYSSLAALVMSVSVVVICLVMGRLDLAELLGLMAALLWWKHRENIGRLRAGTEGKIGAKG